MKRYLEKVKQYIKGYTTAQFQQIPREENIDVDVLAKTASSNKTIGDQVKVQYVSSINVMEANRWSCQLDHPNCVLSQRQSTL